MDALIDISRMEDIDPLIRKDIIRKIGDNINEMFATNAMDGLVGILVDALDKQIENASEGGLEPRTEYLRFREIEEKTCKIRHRAIPTQKIIGLTYQDRTGGISQIAHSYNCYKSHWDDWQIIELTPSELEEWEKQNG